MALKDLITDIMGMFSKVRGDATRRPDGGTSHYSPMRKKTDPAAQQPAENMQYVHTGFTGMTPPSDYSFGQGNANGGTWTQAPVQAPAHGTYFASNAGADTGMGTGFNRARQDNISYMPGFAPANREAGNTLHVEHIMTLTGLKSCYEAIECMKNGETLIVMLDAIANESESMRCQDMLAGAAFTLGCTVRLLNGARIVVIAPEGVLILPEQQGMPEGIRPPEMMATRMTAAAEAPRPGRRERRTSSNAADWTAARNGQMDNYNPYTGTLPVAAGSYGSFGGYGY
ncbi:MAG: cell division protein SepF [Clostridia bacterium]|nr:cell division protein SepF [Clostridia bacterium]MBQ9402579.1 cell division protein SepF [Clostridia bacterium]